MPLFSGGLSYPFYCGYLQQGMSQPMVDNQDRFGIEIDNTQGRVQGYSKDCQHPTELQFYVIDATNQISLYQGEVLDQGDWLVRLEIGTINRYYYYILMPVTPEEVDGRSTASLWNKELIYQFLGGAGIGFRQGSINIDSLITGRLAELQQGMAVISSSVNRTSHTYHFLLAEDTARRVKRQFISLYGQPDFTMGIGGSGGAIAQYLLAQNAPGLLDGAIAQYSYPDMQSQALTSLDCNLFH
ncbi:MAG: DUF6351 family protein, partial [Pseudohongiellaceae bacterium]